METGKNLMVSLADVLDVQAQVESGGNPTARSYKNARGLHQFMPATWRQYGRGKDINDPVANRDAAARYLTDLYKKHGSLPLALAAYNGGDKGAEYLARNPQFMHHPDKSAPINTWRHQTGDYVNKIMTALDRMSPIRSANAAEDENPEANDYAQTDDPITSNEPERTQRTQQPEIDDWQEMPKTTAPAAEIDDWQEVAPTQQNNTTQDDPMQQSKPREQSIAKTILNTAGDIGLGALQGAGNIGATLMQPIDYAMDKTGQQNVERRRSLTEGLKNLGAETESIPFKAGEFGSEMAGTWAAGGALSKAGKVARYAPELAAALETGGMAKTALLPRVAGGAISGAAQTGMVNPEEAGTGAAFGGAIPLVGKAISGVSKLATGGNITPEVRSLAEKAGQYGIDIPVDRILKSKPLNAAAASLEYLPFSGRSETMDKVADQFKIAISKTMGENTSNLAESVNNARQELGKKFDDVLSNNRVVADSTFVNDLLDLSQKADEELLNNAPVIKNQIDKLLNAIDPNGTIDGNGAYEVKKRLDKLSKSNEHGYLANDVKQSLMDALNRSLPADKADDFAKVRKQYQSLLTVEPLVQAGAEGNVSLARFANLHKTGHKQLDELRDISGQFLRTRESPHSAGQRITLGGLAAGGAGFFGGVPVIAGTLAGGRIANEALNSKVARKMALNGVQPPRTLAEILAKTTINRSTQRDK